MKNITKILLIILAASSFVLSIYNHNNFLTETSFDPVELTYAKRIFGIGILCAGLYLFKKNWRNGLTKIMIGVFGISLALNLYLFIQIF